MLKRLEKESEQDSTALENALDKFKKRGETEESQNLKDFEKAFGLRIRKLCEGEDKQNKFKYKRGDNYAGDEYIDDAAAF